jgi:hypothetical protein
MQRWLLPLIALTLAARPGYTQQLLTVAERSDYKATSKHAEVVEYCQELAKKSPLIRLAELGVTTEGRKLPLVILADPPVATPEEAVKSGKLVVFAMGNIHAGEVDGKEGLLMLMRDVALAKDRPLLKDLVLLFVPNFNADGGDKISATNRKYQNGPPEVGTRENAQKFDLNRDYIKLESPEVRALVQFFNKWDPALIIDCHTTDGSRHNHTITYDGPRHPASGAGLIDFTRDTMLPDLATRLKKHSGYLANYYGNFDPTKTLWESYPAQPRYGTQYVGLRHRIGILSESYVYASYKDRVLASRDFVLSCFEFAAQNKDAIRKVLHNAEANSAKAQVALRHKQVPLGKEVTIVGIEGGNVAPPGTTKEFVVTYLGKCEPTLQVTRPFAYVVPSTYKTAIETLQRHGIVVEGLMENAEANVEVYRVDKLSKAAGAYQGHRAVTVEATMRAGKQQLKAGDVIIRSEQPLGTLVAFLLEPQSEDGLCTWNFFDDGLTEGGDYPVLRLPAKVALKTRK